MSWNLRQKVHSGLTRPRSWNLKSQKPEQLVVCLYLPVFLIPSGVMESFASISFGSSIPLSFQISPIALFLCGSPWLPPKGQQAPASTSSSDPPLTANQTRWVPIPNYRQRSSDRSVPSQAQRWLGAGVMKPAACLARPKSTDLLRRGNTKADSLLHGRVRDLTFTADVAVKGVVLS